MNEFDIYIYNKYLDFVGIIDSFSSLRWRRQYFDNGEFEMHIPYNEKTKIFIQKNNILVREDSEESGIIESINIIDNGEYDEAVVIGRFLSSILERRIIKKRINFSGDILDFERKILSDMTPFKNLIINPATLESDNIILQVTYKNVSKYLIKLAKVSGIAHRIKADLKNKKYIYENYQGLDRTESQIDNVRYEFSEDKANIENADYTLDTKEEKNYALVGGVGEGDNRILAEVYNGEVDDFDLKEIFVDAKELSNDNLTKDEYEALLINKGKENLVSPTESMEVTAYASDYKIHWDLGDIVNVKKESWGIIMKERITEIEEVYENSTLKIHATFGSPLKEAYDEDDEDY